MSKSEKINSQESENLNKNKLKLSEKVIGNAISSYLMLFISGLFLFNKSNPNINNDFVKSHTKSALLIHLGFLITYIVFISNNLFGSIFYLGMGLNDILANIIFIGLLFLLILGIYRAKKGFQLKVFQEINISQKGYSIDLNGDGDLTEKEKLTILLSFVPIVGFINYGKYRKSPIIQEIVKVNIFISFIISILYIFGHINLSNLVSLVYIILITFIGVNLFSRDELIKIKLPNYFSPEKLFIILKSINQYLKRYFSDNSFILFSNIIDNKYKEFSLSESKNEAILKKAKDIKLPKYLIYVPFISFIFIFFINSRYRFHIINSLVISSIIILLIGLSFFTYIDSKIFLLFIFPISFGIGYLNNRLAYKMPFFYDIYSIGLKIKLFLTSSSKKIIKKNNEVNELNLKVK